MPDMPSMPDIPPMPPMAPPAKVIDGVKKGLSQFIFHGHPFLADDMMSQVVSQVRDELRKAKSLAGDAPVELASITE